MSNFAIEVKNISKQFENQQVLNDISYSFEKGKIYGIIGNNGSGKTVLMKCITGFIIPDSGYVTVNGKRVGKDVDFPSDMGIIIETPVFLPNLTGLKNLSLLAALRGVIKEDDVIRAITRVGLDPNLKKPVSKYSLGMRQRLGIAQAIMEKQSILILDEPFNGLDKHSVAHIHELIKDLREQGVTIILASHNPIDIDELCDTVVEMDEGILTLVRATPKM